MASDASPTIFTSSDRIRQLNAIDTVNLRLNPTSTPFHSSSETLARILTISQSVTQLLHSASLAISALTSSSPSSSSTSTSFTSPPPTSSSPITQRNTFTNSTKTYFSLLSTIDVQLRRQIYALEEAEIIPPLPPSTTQPSNSQPSSQSLLSTLSSTPSQSPSQLEEGVRGVVAGNEGRSAVGNLGSLDISWLNTRNSKIEREMEAELWKAADELLEKFEGQEVGKGDSREGDGNGDGNGIQ